MLEEIGAFYLGTQQWVARVAKDPLERLVKGPKLSVQIVPVDNKPLSEKVLKNSTSVLMALIKEIIDCITDNSEEPDLPESLVYILYYIFEYLY
jgi:hypothetical protein